MNMNKYANENIANILLPSQLRPNPSGSYPDYTMLLGIAFYAFLLGKKMLEASMVNEMQ